MRLRFIALFLTVSPLLVRATTLQQLSLDDMIQKSTAIVRARVTGTYTAARGRIIYTHYTVQVTEE
ncbi:MAG: hypothetical protein ACRETD_07990, partial [Steroidobacteraceae bacterium]